MVLTTANVAVATDQPGLTSAERTRVSFGRKIELAPDDVRAFLEAAGYRDLKGALRGRLEVFVEGTSLDTSE